MSDRFKIHPRRAGEILSNPDLTSYEADRYAMGWIDRYKEINKLQDEAVKSAAQKPFVEALRQHRQWSEENYSRPLSNIGELRQHERDEKFSVNLPRWNDLFSDDNFDKEIERRGLKGSYDRALEMGMDKTEARNIYRRRLFTKDITGKSNDPAQNRVAGGVLGLTEFSNEAFLQGAKGWIDQNIQKNEREKLEYAEGVKFFLENKPDREKAAEFERRKLEDREGNETFWKAYVNMKNRFGTEIGQARAIIRDVQADEGLERLGEETKFDINKVVELYKSGRRDEFLYVLGKVAELEGTEIDGLASKMLASGERVFKGFANRLRDKSLRRAREEMEQDLRDNPRGGVFDENTQETIEGLRELERIRADLDNLPDAINQVNADGNFEKAMIFTAQSLPYMAMMVNPGTMMAAGASIQEERYQEIKQMNPRLPDDQASALAAISAGAEVGIERLQVMGLFGKFPGMQKIFDKVPKGGALPWKQIIATTGAEYTQETLQEAVFPATLDLFNYLDENVPEGNWEHFKVMDSDRLLAVLPLSILGGGGQWARERFQLAEIGRELQDARSLEFTGIPAERAEEISEMAKKDPQKALGMFRETYNGTPTEKREANGKEAFEKAKEEALEGEPSDFPQIITRDGQFHIDYQDGRVEPVGSMEEAAGKVDQWIREEQLNNEAAVQELSNSLMEKVEGDNTVETGERRTLQDLVNMGQETEANARKAIAIYEAQSGLPPSNAGLDQYFENGSVRLKKDMSGFAVRLAEGQATPLTVAEEFSEGFLRLMVQNGQLTFDDAKGLLDEFGTLTGRDMTKGYDKDPERAIIEGFSEFTKGYLYQSDSDALPQSTRDWVNKSKRFLENPDSLPAKARALMDFFLSLLRSVFQTAQAIRQAKEAGNLNAELEILAQRALGLDMDAVIESQQEQIQNELQKELGVDQNQKSTFQIQYRIDHQPNPDDSRIHSLEDLFGEDIYGPNAQRYYGSFQKGEEEVIEIFRKARGNPDLEVTLYRVVPDFVDKINPGDWVTLSKEAAEEMNFPEFLGRDAKGKEQKPKIITLKAKAAEVVWPGDSFQEQGYFPEGYSPDQATFSITPAQEANRLENAIDKLFTGSSEIVETGKKLKKRLAKIRERQEAADVDEMDQVNAVIQLNAIASVLPKEVRHVVGSPVPLMRMGEERRKKEIYRKINKVSTALEKTIQKGYRKKVRKLIDQSTATTNKATRRKVSKIGAAGHRVADAAVEAMTKSPVEAAAIADGIRAEFQQQENPTLDQWDEAEGRALAFELFADYDNADSARLERAIEFLESNYAENRAEWLGKLKERKEQREERVAQLMGAIGATDFADFGDITRANKKSKTAKGVFDRAAQELLSFYQMLDIIAEKTDSPEIRATVKEMSDSFRHARNDFADNLDKRQDEVIDKIAEILGINGLNKAARINGELARLSKPEPVNVTLRTGRRPEEVEVDKKIAESIVRGEVSGNPGDDFDAEDRLKLERAWEAFQDLPEKVQNGRKYVRFMRTFPAGPRKGIGEISQLDLAKEWLALQQTDAREKYETGGWDQQTLEEIEREMLPETKEIAQFLQDYLREMTPEVDDLHREEYGLALASIENYFPILFNVGQDNKEISMDGSNMSVSARKGSFLKSRVAHHNAMPRQANALAVMQSHLANVEFWKTHAPVLREWGGVLRNQQLQHAMQAKLGQEFTTNINNWLNNIEANGREQTLSNLVADTLVRKLTSGLALSVLGAKLKTVAVNMTAALNVTLGVPITDLLRGLSPRVLKDMKTLVNSPTFQRRLKSGGSYEASVALEQRLGGGLTATTLRRAAQLGMQPINFADTLSNLTMALAYRARVVENRKAGMDEEAAQANAIDYVDELVTRVAQPTDMLSRSLFENRHKSGIGGVLFLFASEARKNTALMAMAARKLATGKGAQSGGMAAQQLFIGMLAYTALGYALRAIVQAAVDDDENNAEGYLERLSDQVFNAKALTHAIMTEHLRGIPFLGEAASSSVAKVLNETDLQGENIMTFDSSSNPLMRTQRGFGSAKRAITADNTDEMVDGILDTMQNLAGIIPETAVFSQAANLSEDALGFWRNVTGEMLSEEAMVDRSVSQISKKKEAIYSVDKEEFKEAKGRERKAISKKREIALEEMLENEKAQAGPDMWPDVYEQLLEKKTIPKDILKGFK